jgi:hypothetical protein
MKIPGNITVDNKLITGKRAVSVYHHATRGNHLISHNGSVTLPLKPVEEGDYLHISVTRGPGRLRKDCLLDIPWWLDFEFAGEGKVFVTHKRNRVFVKIPAGPPVWQLKLTQPADLPPGNSAADGNHKITIGEVEITKSPLS